PGYSVSSTGPRRSTAASSPAACGGMARRCTVRCNQPDSDAQIAARTLDAAPRPFLVTELGQLCVIRDFEGIGNGGHGVQDRPDVDPALARHLALAARGVDQALDGVGNLGCRIADLGKPQPFARQ